MRIRMLFSLLVLFLSASLAQATVSVASLVDSDSLVIGALIPIQIQGLPGANILKVEAADVGLDTCRVMRDPFLPTIFHLKCVAAVEALHIRVSVVENGTPNILSYGPLKIKEVAPGLVVIKPPSDGLDPVKYELGRSNFSTYCQSCHGSPINSAIANLKALGRPPAYLKSTIILGDKNGMGTGGGSKSAVLSGILTDSGIDALAYYINNYQGH